MRITPQTKIPYKNISFGTGLFKIANIDYLPCAYCGNDMISIKKLNETFQNKISKDSSMLDSAIENGYLLKPFQQDVLSYFLRTKSQYDLKTDGQILSKACRLSKDEVSDDVMDRFYKIVDAIELSSDKRLKDFLAGNFKFCEPALNRKSSYKELIKFVRSPSFLHVDRNIKDGIEGKINEIIYDIDVPSEYSVQSFIIDKALKKSIEEFYKLLFEKSTSTIEHLRPKSNGGKDEISNYLAVCRDCNSKRKSISFPKFLDLKPEIKNNIEKQLYKLSTIIPQLIKSRKLDNEYTDYTKNVSETLKKISEGKINLDNYNIVRSP